MDKCDNFEDGKCRYFEMLRGTGEELPTGADANNGDCLVIQSIKSWIEAELEDCDMLDYVDVDDDEE